MGTLKKRQSTRDESAHEANMARARGRRRRVSRYTPDFVGVIADRVCNRFEVERGERLRPFVIEELEKADVQRIASMSEPDRERLIKELVMVVFAQVNHLAVKYISLACSTILDSSHPERYARLIGRSQYGLNPWNLIATAASRTELEIPWLDQGRYEKRNEIRVLVQDVVLNPTEDVLDKLFKALGNDILLGFGPKSKRALLRYFRDPSYLDSDNNFTSDTATVLKEKLEEQGIGIARYKSLLIIADLRAITGLRDAFSASPVLSIPSHTGIILHDPWVFGIKEREVSPRRFDMEGWADMSTFYVLAPSSSCLREDRRVITIHEHEFEHLLQNQLSIPSHRSNSDEYGAFLAEVVFAGDVRGVECRAMGQPHRSARVSIRHDLVRELGFSRIGDLYERRNLEEVRTAARVLLNRDYRVRVDLSYDQIVGPFC